MCQLLSRKDENKEKEAGSGPFKKTKHEFTVHYLTLTALSSKKSTWFFGFHFLKSRISESVDLNPEPTLTFDLETA